MRAWHLALALPLAGVWRSDKRCWFNAPKGGVNGAARTNYVASSTSGFYCACLNTNVAKWQWLSNSACLSGASAASILPSPCRFHKYRDATQWTMGYISSADGYCTSPNTYFGAGGTLLNRVSGIGGPSYGMQILCRQGAWEGCAQAYCVGWLAGCLAVAA